MRSANWPKGRQFSDYYNLVPEANEVYKRQLLAALRAVAEGAPMGHISPTCAAGRRGIIGRHGRIGLISAVDLMTTAAV